MTCEELHQLDLDEMADWLVAKVYKFDRLFHSEGRWEFRFVWATGPADGRNYELVKISAKSYTRVLCDAVEWVMNARRADNTTGSKHSPHPSPMKRMAMRRAIRERRAGA